MGNHNEPLSSPGSLFQRYSVHAISQTAGLGAIGENVPQMAVTRVADRLNSFQERRSVKAIGDHIFLDRLREGRPTCARLVLFGGIKQDGFAAQAGVDSRFKQTAHR